MEVAEYDSSTDEEEEPRKWKVEPQTFRDLTDGQYSYWELPHVLGDKSGSTTGSTTDF